MPSARPWAEHISSQGWQTIAYATPSATVAEIILIAPKYTTLLFDLNLVFIFVLYNNYLFNTNKRNKSIEKHRVFQ